MKLKSRLFWKIKGVLENQFQLSLRESCVKIKRKHFAKLLQYDNGILSAATAFGKR